MSMEPLAMSFKLEDFDFLEQCRSMTAGAHSPDCSPIS